jgi:hypothetical protein
MHTKHTPTALQRLLRCIHIQPTAAPALLRCCPAALDTPLTHTADTPLTHTALDTLLTHTADTPLTHTALDTPRTHTADTPLTHTALDTLLTHTAPPLTVLIACLLHPHYRILLHYCTALLHISALSHRITPYCCITKPLY